MGSPEHSFTTGTSATTTSWLWGDGNVRLDDLRIAETSGVDAPAHLAPGWAVMKSAGASSTAPEHHGVNMPDTINKEALDPEVRAFIEDLEKRAGAAEAPPTDPPADGDDVTKAFPPAKADGDEEEEEEDEDEMEKALANPTALKKYLQGLEARTLAAETVAKAEMDRRLDAEFVAKAAEFDHLGIDAEEFGPLLRKCAESLGTDCVKLYDVLKGANEAVAAGQLFDELGSSSASTSGSTYEKLETMAKSAMQDDSSLTFEAAFVKAIESEPDLYGQYLAEQKGS